MGDDAHDLGVLLDALKLSIDLLGSLRELFGVPGEGLLLGLVPVLVEPLTDTHRIKKKNSAILSRWLSLSLFSSYDAMLGVSCNLQRLVKFK